jgi:hypothetical protein
MFTMRVNFPTPVEEQREVVVRALELEGDRPLRVQLLGDRGARLEGLDFQIGSRRLDLHAAKKIGDVLLVGQHGLEVVEPRFEIGDLAAEFRQLPRRGVAFGDVPVQRGQLELARREVGAHRQLDVVVEGA